MNKFISIMLSIFLSAISTAEKLNEYSFEKIKTITLGTEASELMKILGDPSSKDTLKIANKNFIVWDYKEATRTRFEFLIDPLSKSISQKIFFPLPKSSEANIKNLLDHEFKTMRFKKLLTNCAHHGEFAYVNSSSGLFILTRESEDQVAPAAAISWATASTAELQLKENADSKCQK